LELPENLKVEKSDQEKKIGSKKKKSLTCLKRGKTRHTGQISFSDLENIKSETKIDEKPEKTAEETNKEASDNSKNQSSLFDF